MGIVIASPNPEFRQRVVESLRSADQLIQEVSGGAEALAAVEEGLHGRVLLDRWLPDLDVQDLSRLMKKRFPDLEVFVAGSAQDTACPIGISAGEDFCSFCSGRPDDARCPNLEAPDANSPVPPTVPIPKSVEPLPGMIGTSDSMQQVYRLARLVSARSTPVLISGETGTGKELVARAIHQLSPRARQPMVTVNCAAIPEPLLEAELFGHARGAFTGAFQSRLGRIQSAHGGTLFLDEVSEAPLSIQAKFLRFLQEGEVQRLGSPDIVRVDVRVVAATNADLARRVAEGRFREDLFYRLMVFPITLVPLRKHSEDVPALANFFLSAFSKAAKTNPKTLSREAEEALKRCKWPGNVRELHHRIERAFILAESGSTILPEHVALQEPAGWKSAPNQD